MRAIGVDSASKFFLGMVSALVLQVFTSTATAQVEPLYEEREIYFERHYRNQTLDLTFLFDLNPIIEPGLEIISVDVRVGGFPDAELILLANRRVQARDQATPFTLLIPRDRLRLGRNVNELHLQVRGMIYLERIILTVSRDRRR